MAKKQIVASAFNVTAAPEDGAKGSRGQLPYPAGEYDLHTSYICTDMVAPYVLYNGIYYVMNQITTWVGQGVPSNINNPQKDYAVNGTKATWIPFESYKALYVEILMAQFANFASAIFYDDFMFSQHGVDANGNPTLDYKNFNPNDPLSEAGSIDFVPNYCVNLKTGRQFLGKRGSIIFEPKGDIKIRGTVIYPTEIKSGNSQSYRILPGDNINRLIITGNKCNVELVGSSDESGREVTIDYLPYSLYQGDSLKDGTQNRLVVKGRTSALAGVDNFVSSPIYNGVSFNNYISLATKTSAKFRLVPLYDSNSGTVINYRWLLVDMTPYDPVFGFIFCQFYSGIGAFMFRSKYYQDELTFTSSVSGSVTTYKIDMTGIIGSNETDCLITHSSVHLDGRTSGTPISIGSFSFESGKTYLTITSSNANPTFNGMILLYTKLGNL